MQDHYFSKMFNHAVHLEITSDLKAENLLLALKRLISRRSKSTKFIRDNAKTFKNSKKLKWFLIQKNTTCNFISGKIPWWGEFYEQLIRIVKSSLKKVLQKSFINIWRTLYCHNRNRKSYEFTLFNQLEWRRISKKFNTKPSTKFTTSHSKTFNFVMCFFKVRLHLAHFVSYKRFPFRTKDIGLILVCRNSAALIFTSLLLQKLIISLFKIYSTVVIKLLWITVKCHI